MIVTIKIGKEERKISAIIIKIEKTRNILALHNPLLWKIILIVKVHRVGQVFIQVKISNIKVLREVEAVMTNAVIELIEMTIEE